MTDREVRRVRRPATAEELRKLQTYREQVARDLPDLRRQAIEAGNELRAAALQEPTVSGQLRRAIAESGMDHHELAALAEVSPKSLAEFLLGAAALDSLAVDKLAAVLRHELKPIG